MLSIMGNLLYWLKLIDQNNLSPIFLWLLHHSWPHSFGIQFSSKPLPTRFCHESFGLTFIDSGACIFIFFCFRGIELKPCIYYALYLSIELS